MPGCCVPGFVPDFAPELAAGLAPEPEAGFAPEVAGAGLVWARASPVVRSPDVMISDSFIRQIGLGVVSAKIEVT